MTVVCKGDFPPLVLQEAYPVLNICDKLNKDKLHHTGSHQKQIVLLVSYPCLGFHFLNVPSLQVPWLLDRLNLTFSDFVAKDAQATWYQLYFFIEKKIYLYPSLPTPRWLWVCQMELLITLHSLNILLNASSPVTGSVTTSLQGSV